MHPTLKILPVRGLLLASLGMAACVAEPATQQDLGPVTLPPTGTGDGGSGDGGSGDGGSGDGDLGAEDPPPFSPGGEISDPPSTGNDSGSDATTGELPDDDASTGSGSGSGSLPSVGDLKQLGPFKPMSAAGPAGYVVFHPEAL